MRYVKHNYTPRKSKCLLEVRESQISGLGLFTKETIERDQFVIEYWGDIVTGKDRKLMANGYYFLLTSKSSVDGARKDNIARYINHSCVPNCYVYYYNKRIYINAARVIKIGEELTFDYGEEYYNGIIRKIGCRCKRCKKRTAKRS